MKRRKLFTAGAIVASIALAACGSGSGSDSKSAATTAPAGSGSENSDPAVSATEDSMASSSASASATASASTAPATVAPGGAKANPDALVIWADERKIEPIKAIAPEFTKQTGVEVVVELVKFDQIRDRVTQAGPAGEGPDVFVGAHDWTGELAANGVISTVDVSAVQDSFVPVALQGFNFEGKNYAVPYVTEAIAMYRNKDLVPDAPTTWDELIKSCETAEVENCVTIPGGGDATDAYHNYPFLSAFGGYIFKYDAATGFDASDIGLGSPEAIKGMNFLADQVKSGIVPSTNYDNAKNLWLEGKAAYWITGPWELGDTRKQTGVPNWDVSLIPQMGDTPTQPFVGAQGFFVSSFSEKQVLAQSFLLDYIATDATMQALYDADPRGTAWVKVQDGLTSDPQVQTFSQSAANGIPMPNIPQMSAVWGPLGDNILLVRNGKATGDEAMTAAADAVKKSVTG